MSAVLGIDFSSRAVDLVKLDENAEQAERTRIPLHGEDAIARTRTLRDVMPRAWFYEDVYLVALEKPMGFASRLGQSVLMRVQGAILISVPSRVEVWEVLPAAWKAHIGLKPSEKPAAAAFTGRGFDDVDDWSQDSLDALGLAVYARDVNAAGIAKRLEEVIDLT